MTKATIDSAAGAANGLEAPRAGGRPHRRGTVARTPLSAAEDAAVQDYLQLSLAISAAAARALTRRTALPHLLLQLGTCEGWVSYLHGLASGDTAVVLAILHKQPGLLDRLFDQRRLQQLQQHLTAALGIKQPQLLDMAQRWPHLLRTPLATVAAATEFLLTQLGGNTAAAHAVAVANPRLMSASVAALQGGLQCLTEQLGVPQVAAVGQLSKMIRCPVAARLASRGQWLQQLGFTPAQTLTMARLAPALFSTSTDILQHRLAAFTHTYGMTGDSARAMIAAAPSVWSLNFEGRLTQLKLRYWQQELGYSLSDLPLAARFLMASLSTSASRFGTLRDLLATQLTPEGHMRALTPTRGGSRPADFGPTFLSAYVRQHSSSSGSGGGGASGSSSSSSSGGSGGGGGSVQQLLQPLTAKLSQPAHQQQWLAVLGSHPPLPSPGRCSTPQYHQLYAALDAIAARDWAMSASGVQWTTAEAEAKAADHADRVAERALIIANRVALKVSSARPGSSGGEVGGATAGAARDEAPTVSGDGVQAKTWTRRPVGTRPLATTTAAASAAALSVARSGAAAAVRTTAAATASDTAGTLPPASAPPPAGAAPAAAQVAVEALAAVGRQATWGPGVPAQAVPEDADPDKMTDGEWLRALLR